MQLRETEVSALEGRAREMYDAYCREHQLDVFHEGHERIVGLCGLMESIIENEVKARIEIELDREAEEAYEEGEKDGHREGYFEGYEDGKTGKENEYVREDRERKARLEAVRQRAKENGEFNDE